MADSKEYKTVFTIGCFDLFHKGHAHLLERINSKCDRLVVGVHDNNSVKQIKNKDVEDISIRTENVKMYADEVFVIDNADPTNSFKEYVEEHQHLLENACFMRADDNKQFPGKDYISSVMKIEYLSYSKGISSTMLVDRNNKIGVMDQILKLTSRALEDNNIEHYLDCGTLLGCVRDRGIIEYDTDVDITIHLSDWEKLKAIDFTKYGLTVFRVLSGYPFREDGNLISVQFEHRNDYCDIYANPAFPKLETRILNGTKYNVPLDPDLYLTQLYGNWRVPSRGHALAIFHRNRGLINSRYKQNWDPKYEIYKTQM